jgi:hypothetical protein
MKLAFHLKASQFNLYSLTKTFIPLEGISLGEILSREKRLTNYEPILKVCQETYRRRSRICLKIRNIHRCFANSYIRSLTPKTEIMRALNDVALQESVR